MSGTEWDRSGQSGAPLNGMGLGRPVSDRILVSESHSTVFDTQNESRFATVQSSGTREVSRLVSGKRPCFDPWIQTLIPVVGCMH